MGLGGGKLFADLPKPDLVLLTHLHADHFDPATLEAIVPAGDKPTIIAPASVAEKISETLRGKTKVKILANGEKTEVEGITIEAVPAYNIAPEKAKFHPKGRDNGYVLTMGGKKIYVAGDTEDTAEMRALKGIDVAFLPMNLPYTMSVEKAAEAIRQVKPKIVYPTTAATTARRRTSSSSESWSVTISASKSGVGTGIPSGNGRVRLGTV